MPCPHSVHSYLDAKCTYHSAARVLAIGPRLQGALVSAPVPWVHFRQVAERFLACFTAPALLVLHLLVPAHVYAGLGPSAQGCAGLKLSRVSVLGICS